MDGILIIDKPAGITSHDVVNKVRRILKTKRVGHTGTLDPFATGVVVVLVGQATRLARFLDKDEKAYEAVICFGFETNTGDFTGDQSTPLSGSEMPTADEVRSIFGEFLGQIEQIPPMFSAKKIGGDKLYELARKGQTIERKPISVKITHLETADAVMHYDPDAGTSDITIKVVCSAGTYVRTLAEDIGRRLGVGAHLAGLRRAAAGRFSIADAITLEQLASRNDPAAVLVPMEIAVSHLKEMSLNEERVVKTRNGLATRVMDSSFSLDEFVRMLDEDKNLIAIGRFDSVENVVQPKVVLV